MRPVAAGALPEDLIAAVCRGVVRLREVSHDVVVFYDEGGCVEWHCELDAGRLCSYKYKGTSESAHIPCFSAVKKVTLKQKQTSVSCEAESQITDLQLFPDSPTALVSFSDVTQKYHSLATRLAHFLAPAPRDNEDLRRRFASESAEAVSTVLGALTTTNRRGQLELVAAGYGLVDIESYSSKATKQQVANLALPKVAHNKALLDRFMLYADRDVMLSVCSKGIMAGLGSSKRRREDDDVSDEDSDGGVGERAEKAEQEGEEHAGAAALFTSMEQVGVRWDDGDLTRAPDVMSTMKEVLAQRQCAEKGDTKRAGANTTLAPMPILNQSQLDSAKDRYGVLWGKYQLIHSFAMRVSEINAAVREWCQVNTGRISAKLADELRLWFAAQEEPRATLLASFEILHSELYKLKREIEEYVNLREWGVFA